MIKVWEFSTGRLIRSFEGASCINSICVTPDSKYVVSGSGDILSRSKDNTVKGLGTLNG